MDDFEQDDCQIDDCRLVFDPDNEIPNWFWDLIEQGQQNENVFREVLRSIPHAEYVKLVQIAYDLAGFFSEPPFCPPSSIISTQNELLETGLWVVSQGRGYFSRIWNKPELFWKLIEGDTAGVEQERNYMDSMEAVWWERFPDEELPIQ